MGCEFNSAAGQLGDSDKATDLCHCFFIYKKNVIYPFLEYFEIDCWKKSCLNCTPLPLALILLLPFITAVVAINTAIPCCTMWCLSTHTPFSKAEWSCLHGGMWPALLILSLMTVFFFLFPAPQSALIFTAFQQETNKQKTNCSVLPMEGSVTGLLCWPPSLKLFFQSWVQVTHQQIPRDAAKAAEQHVEKRGRGKWWAHTQMGKHHGQEQSISSHPWLPQAEAQPLGVPCRAAGWRRHSAPLPHRGFIMGKTLLCQHPTLIRKPDLPRASSHGPTATVPCSSCPSPPRS